MCQDAVAQGRGVSPGVRRSWGHAGDMPGVTVPGPDLCLPRLLHMLVEELGHLKHRDLVASQDLFQRGIRMNLASVLRVLELVGLYVGPHAFVQHRPRQRCTADNIVQLMAGGYRW